MSKSKVHFLIGTRWFGVLGPCRLIIEQLVQQGYTVYVFGQKDDHYARYDDGNAKLIEINMARSYTAFLSDILDILKITFYILKYKPDGVHSFNPKPALLSWASVLFSPKTKFFIGVTGLGNTFIRAKNMERFITWALTMACKRASFVFFQNRDDIALFRDKKIVEDSKTKMFIGPGVDLRQFRPDISKNSELECQNEDESDIIVTCTARLIWQKGIREYIEAAKIVKEKYRGLRKVTFRLLGEVDVQHPDCIDENFLKAAVADGAIEHVSWTDDIVSELKKSDIFVLHSYREGAPRAILEASALELPTVGADAIGVRELIEDGVTGYLTPLKEVEPIADAICKLIDDPVLRRKMGKAARKNIAEPYSLTKSSDAQCEMYRSVGYALPTILPHPLETLENQEHDQV
jgi:N,N'-diacetylbacillosaminyl-diphospho-undecaprenol alpha-1,3-N-acetylgalactosaminyltransferase